MRIVSRGIVCDPRAEPPARRICTFPSLARMQSGRLVCSFRTGSAKDSADEDNRVLVSDNEGKTWQAVFDGFGDVPPGSGGRIRCLTVSAAEGDCLLGSLNWLDRSDPSLPMFNPQSEGLLPTKVLFAISEDAGRTWSAALEIPMMPHRGNAITGPILRLTDSVPRSSGHGRLALPYEAWKGYHDREPGRHHASLRISDDGGATWPELSIVAHDREGRVLYWDQRLGIAPDTGELVAMFWTHDRQTGQDWDIHIAWGEPDGRRWSKPVSTGIAGQICVPLPLGGGRLFAAYVHRRHPPTLRAVLSDDMGRTWDLAEELVFYEKELARPESGMGDKRDFADYWADMGIWTFGHPAPILLSDGNVLIAYYAGDQDVMGIHCARIALD